MRFRQPSNDSIQVNIVPMLDVMMTVLTFFIILSMTLGRQSSVQIALPGTDEAPQPTPTSAGLPEPLVLEALSGDKLTIAGRALATPDAIAAARTYLQKNPKGLVLLKPSPDLPYEKVLQLLGDLRQLDPDRVSLGLDGPEADTAEPEPNPGAAPEAAAPEAPPPESTTPEAIPADGDPAAAPAAPADQTTEPAAPENPAPAAPESAAQPPAAAAPAPGAAAEAWPED